MQFDGQTVGIIAALSVIVHFARHGFLPSQLRVCNAQRRQNLLSHILTIRYAGDLFDHAAQKKVSEVRIGVTFAGGSFEGIRVQRLLDENHAISLHAMKHRVVFFVRPASGGVREQMLHRDGLQPIGMLPQSKVFENTAGAEDTIAGT